MCDMYGAECMYSNKWGTNLYFYVSQESLWISSNQKNIVDLKEKKEVTFVQTFLLSSFLKSDLQGEMKLTKTRNHFWIPVCLWQTMTSWRYLTLAPVESGTRRAPRCPLLAQWPGWHQRSYVTNPARRRWMSGRLVWSSGSCWPERCPTR